MWIVKGGKFKIRTKPTSAPKLAPLIVHLRESCFSHLSMCLMWRCMGNSFYKIGFGLCTSPIYVI